MLWTSGVFDVSTSGIFDICMSEPPFAFPMFSTLGTSCPSLSCSSLVFLDEIRIRTSGILTLQNLCGFLDESLHFHLRPTLVISGLFRIQDEYTT
jgi:hypothetical protein